MREKVRKESESCFGIVKLEVQWPVTSSSYVHVSTKLGTIRYFIKMNLWRAIFVTFFLVIKKVVSHNEFSIVTEEPEFGPERVVFQVTSELKQLQLFLFLICQSSCELADKIW